MSATIAASSRRDYSRHVGVGFIALAALLVILLSVSRFGNQTEYSKHIKVSGDIQGIGTQLKLYHSVNGFFPTTDQGLRALVKTPSASPQPRRRYQLLQDVPNDPWQNEYIYRCPGTKHPDGYDLFSPGPDHKPDTKDDDWGG
jgi:general secretion pathway protein G